MHGLVSLLPPPYYQRVESLWRELEQEFGLTGIKVTPYPHFSWQIAEDYDFDRLDRIMRQIAGEARPFTVQTAGIGLFTGPKPVIYIAVVKSPPLMEFHDMLWERAQPAGRHISAYYSPSSWIPHISLAYEDVEQSNIAAVIENLAFQSFMWEMTIDNLSLIYEPGGAIGDLKFYFKFSQSKGDAS